MENHNDKVTSVHPDDSVSVGAVRILQALVVLALMAPSPALAPGVFALLSPASLAGLGVVGLTLSNQRRSVVGARTQALLVPVVLAGIGLCASSFLDGSGSDMQRMVGRGVAVFALYGVAMVIAKFPDVEAALRRAVVFGAVTAASIAVLASLFRLRPLGAELLPNRDFVLPIDLKKTTGVPRSFGEAGLIYAGGLVFLQSITKRSVRWAFAGVLVTGVFIGQSRNMLLVLAVVFALKLIAPYVRFRRATTLIGLVGFISPLVVSLFLAQSDLASSLIGEGVFARNVSSRLTLLSKVETLFEVEGYSIVGTTHTRWGNIFGAAPHNHFVSLVVMDGVFGYFFLCVVYLRAIFSAPRVGLKHPTFQWLVAVIFALSFYEGVYSATATLALALFFGSLRQTHDEPKDWTKRAAVNGALAGTPAPTHPTAVSG